MIEVVLVGYGNCWFYWKIGRFWGGNFRIWRIIMYDCRKYLLSENVFWDFVKIVVGWVYGIKYIIF